MFCRRGVAPTKETSHIAAHWAFGSIHLGLVLPMLRQSLFEWKYLMYQKHLRDLEIVFFRYAPPQAFRNDTTSEKLPNPPFSGAAPWQCSVYYYWWLFLREHQALHGGSSELELLNANQDWQLDMRVRSEFGSVTKGGFLRWWILTGRHLFCEAAEQSVRALTFSEVSHGVEFSDSRGVPIHDANIYLQIPVHQDFDKSIEEVRAYLRQAKQRQHVNPDYEARYPVFTKPVLTALEKTYQAWILRKSHPEMPLAELAVEAGLAARADNTDTANKSANASAASRALNQATLLIEWVGKGIFPVTSKSQELRAADMAERQWKKLHSSNLNKALYRSSRRQRTNADLKEQAAVHGLDLDALR